jgi:4-phytase/acid phosphatase
MGTTAVTGSPILRFVAATLALAACLAASHAVAAETAWRLERVVLVMRHGVRPPTQSAAALAKYSDGAWPSDTVWGAAPGDLTPHGAAAIQIFGRDLRKLYAGEGLIAADGGLGGGVLIWADGGDERTRETGKFLALGLSPKSPPAVGFAPQGKADPLFDALDAGACSLDSSQTLAAVEARKPWATADIPAALTRLQQIVAPRACTGGSGVCLQGSDEARADSKGVKLTGPLATSASLAEDLLLEYENGLDGAALGWGRLRRADLDVVLVAHRRMADLTRRTPYIALRRAAPLAELILKTIANAPGDEPNPRLPDPRLIVFVRHDTTLSNLAGVFDLDWTLPGQPDVTAPGTALAFERWRNSVTGGVSVRIRVIYQDADAVRTLDTASFHTLESKPAGCAKDLRYCALQPWREQVQAELKAACPTASPPPLDTLWRGVSPP